MKVSSLSARAYGRLRSAYAMILLAAIVHGITYGTAGALVSGSAGWLFTVSLLGGSAVASGALLLWSEHRRPCAHRPTEWASRSVVVVIPQSVALLIVAVESSRQGGVSLSEALLVGFSLQLIQIALVVRGGLALRRPLTVDLAELSIEIVVPIRVEGRRWEPNQIPGHDVTLTEDEIVVRVRPSPTAGEYHQISLKLVDVIEVRARASRRSDSPWIELDGNAHQVPNGKIVEIHTAVTSFVLPVHEAVAFGELIGDRVRRAHEAARTKRLNAC